MLKTRKIAVRSMGDFMKQNCGWPLRSRVHSSQITEQHGKRRKKRSWGAEESIHKLQIITCLEFSDRLDQLSVTVYENLVKQL